MDSMYHIIWNGLRHDNLVMVLYPTPYTILDKFLIYMHDMASFIMNHSSHELSKSTEISIALPNAE